VIEAQIAAAVIENACAAQPSAVATLDRGQLRLGLIARIDGALLALHAHPGAAQGRQVALLQFVVGESRAG